MPRLPTAIVGKHLSRLPMIQRILVATDGSPRSLSAARLAGSIARCTGATVSLVHVMTADLPPVTVALTPQLAGQEVLHRTRAHLGTSAVTTDDRLLEGDPAAEIIRLADEGRYDLIIVGSRKLTRMQRLLLGSVSRTVVEHAPCSIMVARPRQRPRHP